MENSRLLVDTSILIDFLRKKDKSKSLFYKVISKHECYISVITLFEIYSGAVNDDRQTDIIKLLKWLIVLDFNSDMAYHSSRILISLKKKNNLIEFRDIFIGATALSAQLPLLTLNAKHFTRIPELEILSTKDFN